MCTSQDENLEHFQVCLAAPRPNRDLRRQIFCLPLSFCSSTVGQSKIFRERWNWLPLYRRFEDFLSSWKWWKRPHQRIVWFVGQIPILFWNWSCSKSNYHLPGLKTSRNSGSPTGQLWALESISQLPNRFYSRVWTWGYMNLWRLRNSSSADVLMAVTGRYLNGCYCILLLF